MQDDERKTHRNNKDKVSSVKVSKGRCPTELDDFDNLNSALCMVVCVNEAVLRFVIYLEEMTKHSPCFLIIILSQSLFCTFIIRHRKVTCKIQIKHTHSFDLRTDFNDIRQTHKFDQRQ